MEEENNSSQVGYVVSFAVLIGLLAACAILFFALSMVGIVTWSVL